jgi:hypothetical protein
MEIARNLSKVLLTPAVSPILLGSIATQTLPVEGLPRVDVAA